MFATSKALAKALMIKNKKGATSWKFLLYEKKDQRRDQKEKIPTAVAGILEVWVKVYNGTIVDYLYNSALTDDKKENTLQRASKRPDQHSWMDYRT